MLFLISPAKTLDYSDTETKEYSIPRLLDQSDKLINTLKKKSHKSIQNLMDVSEKIAVLNVARYKEYHTPFSPSNAKQAVLAFKGDVYTGMDTESFDDGDLEFAQQHLLILSGLYGLLKPLDLMQPYRLEMGTKLKTTRGTNLYQFWKDRITNLINEDLEASNSTIVINLASKEYFKSVNTKKLNHPVLNINFKELRNGKYKVVSFSAKKARGMMCHYAIKNKITDPELLKGFDYENYTYNERLSTELDWMFTRDVF